MIIMESESKQQEFARLLLKTPLEPYTQQLYNMFDILTRKDSQVLHIGEAIYTDDYPKLEVCLSISKALLALMKNEPIKIGNELISDEALNEVLKQSLMNEYKKLKLNRRELTPKEAKTELLEKWNDDSYIRNFVYWFRFNDVSETITEEALKASGMLDDFNHETFIIENPELWKLWSTQRGTETTITIKQISNVIKQIDIQVNTLNYEKPRRHVKNGKLIWAIANIRRYYYKGHSNSDYRLMFDCFDFWGLIDEEQKQCWESNSASFDKMKTAYIQSIYNQVLKKYGDLGALKSFVFYKEKPKS